MSPSKGASSSLSLKKFEVTKVDKSALTKVDRTLGNPFSVGKLVGGPPPLVPLALILRSPDMNKLGMAIFHLPMCETRPLLLCMGPYIGIVHPLSVPSYLIDMYTGPTGCAPRLKCYPCR